MTAGDNWCPWQVSHLIQLPQPSPVDSTGSVRESQKPDLESDGKIKATIPLWPSPQQPIPRVTTDLASQQLLQKGVEKHNFFLKMLILFSEKTQATYFIVYVAHLFWNAGLCVGLSSSFIVFPLPSTGPSQQEDHVSPNTRQMSASWSGGTQSCWPLQGPWHLQRLRCLRYELKHSDKHEK